MPRPFEESSFASLALNCIMNIIDIIRILDYGNACVLVISMDILQMNVNESFIYTFAHMEIKNAYVAVKKKVRISKVQGEGVEILSGWVSRDILSFLKVAQLAEGMH